jgi:hypothetical protein
MRQPPSGKAVANETKYPYIVELVVPDDKLDVEVPPDDGLSQVAKNSGEAWTENC